MKLPLDAARLAAWSTACLAGDVAPDALAAPAATGGELHRLSGPAAPGAPGEPMSLPLAVAELRRSGASRCWLAWPVPGDPAGLPGPPEVNRLALAAGQAVVVEVRDEDRGVLLVPASLGASGVLWTALPCEFPRAAATSLSEADRQLKAAMRQATEELDRLDVARVRPEDEDRVEAVRRRPPPLELPPSSSARARVLVDSTQRLATLLAIARDDDGAAVGRSDADGRATVLRDLERAVRHGFVAAVNALAEESARAR